MHPPWHLGRLGPECACIGKLCLNTVEDCWDWEVRFFWRYIFTWISSITVEVGWIHGYFHTGVELGACFRLQAEHFILSFFCCVSISTSWYMGWYGLICELYGSKFGLCFTARGNNCGQLESTQFGDCLFSFKDHCIHSHLSTWGIGNFNQLC